MSLGPKRYSIRYKTFDGEIKEMCKFSGLKPPEDEQNSNIDFENMENLLEEENKEVATYQYLKTKDNSLVQFGAVTIRRVVKMITFNPMKSKRIYQEENHSSKPYGHS